MRTEILPSAAHGTLKAPPSKSMTHRALICAALARGESRLENLAVSEDTAATAGALQCLGAQTDIDESTGTGVVRGMDLSKPPVSDLIDCRASGSTLRFLLPLCLLRNAPMTLTGSRRLLERPLSVYDDVFRKDGISWERGPDRIRIEGKLSGGEYPVRGDVSSQFLTGLLLALPLLDTDSTLSVTGGILSAPYVRMTCGMQRLFGVRTRHLSGDRFEIRGRQSYRPACCRIEGDWSNAAYLEVFAIAAAAGEEAGKIRKVPERSAPAAARRGTHRLTVTGLNESSVQGDRIYRDYFGRLSDASPVLDLSDCPDLGPVLIAAAALRHGAVLTGTARLADKESDRGRAMAEELRKFGIKITVREDSILIPDAPLESPRAVLDGHNDHRIVMALAALCSAVGGIIDGAEAVNKSFPGFFEEIGKAGIIVRKGK